MALRDGRIEGTGMFEEPSRDGRGRFHVDPGDFAERGAGVRKGISMKSLVDIGVMGDLIVAGNNAGGGVRVTARRGGAGKDVVESSDALRLWEAERGVFGTFVVPSKTPSMLFHC